MRRGAYALLALLFVARLPSLVQPAGADQALYAYVGARILDGGLPYRDAWDQKPPAIHFTYAALYAVWPHESVVPAADALAAGVVALMLISIGRTLFGAPSAGVTAAALFLLLGDPTFNRLSGVRIRSQCETFIAVAITAAVLLAVRYRNGTGGRCVHQSPVDRIARRRDWVMLLAVGTLLGGAFTLKYNALVYGVAVLFALIPNLSCVRCVVRRTALVVAGCLLPVSVFLSIFAAGGTLADLYYATIRYNLEYSGETYQGPLSFVAYLLTFPVAHARVDALWTVGGLGCLVLLGVWLRNRSGALVIPVVWVSAACASIAINGSRGLPQYFVQAGPALALAAGLGGAVLWPAHWLKAGARPAARAAMIALVAFGAWRVTDFDKIPRNAAHDLAYVSGSISRETHLARYGGQRDADKYSALAVMKLGTYLETRTEPRDHVYIFGFSPGAYVQAGRVSASRFFWSRPIIVGFNARADGYGPRGLLTELEAHPPKYVILQRHDWAEPPNDSASYFLSEPVLSAWLRSKYHWVDHLDIYDIWARHDVAGDRKIVRQRNERNAVPD